MNKTKVLIVDDSALIRTLLTEIISQDSALEVIGSARDPYDAREKIKKLNPDVITLDIEMPKMDGVTFLKNIMRLRPLPVVMISTLTEKGADITLRSLEMGAVDYVAKPKIAAAEELPKLARDIVSKIKSAAKANISTTRSASVQPAVSKISQRPNNRYSLIAIGASTGGVEATKTLLQLLPEEMPPIVVVQHMPGAFTSSYARRLDGHIVFEVNEFFGGEQRLEHNHVYIANGNEHLCIKSNGQGFVGYCQDSEPVNRHKPAVDVLFDSLAIDSCSRVIAVLLTGMGVDGAAGMSKIKDKGGITIAQDKDSSVVWGMPRVAVEQGAAMHTLPLEKISKFIIEQCYG